MNEDHSNDGADEKSHPAFKVDIRCVGRACDISPTAAVIYVLIASGAWKQSAQSLWSAKAAEKYLGVDRRFARCCIDKLIKAGLIQHTDSSKPKAPHYRLQQWHVIADALPDNFDEMARWRAWLPQRFARLTDHDTPLKDLLYRWDADLLRTAIELYAVTEIGDAGHLPLALLHRPRPGRLFDGNGKVAFHLFDDATQTILGNDERLTASGDTLLEHIETLATMRIVEWVPVLFATPDYSKKLCELDGYILPEVLEAAVKALKPADRKAMSNRMLIPVAEKYRKPALVELLRMNWRPDTMQVKCWYKRLVEGQDAMLELMATLQAGTSHAAHKAKA